MKPGATAKELIALAKSGEKIVLIDTHPLGSVVRLRTILRKAQYASGEQHDQHRVVSGSSTVLTSPSFPPATVLAWRKEHIRVPRGNVSAVMGQPAQVRHQFRRQFDTLGIDGETVLVDPALARDHIQIAAGGLGVEDRTAFVLDLLETAAAAAPAEGLPFIAPHVFSSGLRAAVSIIGRRAHTATHLCQRIKFM